MQTAMGLRWERAVALVIAVVLTLVVALAILGVSPAQADTSDGSYDASMAPVVQVVEHDTTYQWGYDGGGFAARAASFSRMGNSWG